jgi:hydroxymethylpyrimidine pyrophosphatase-like HAD family hydrolase
MTRLIFFSDLDNTIIHSYKHASEGDICVETRDGKGLSYMSQDSYDLLQRVAQTVEFVPVTSRTVVQYRRLTLLSNGVPRFALVCNGAILLNQGKTDEKWARESLESFGGCMAKLPGYKERMEALPDLFFDARLADDFFIFAKRVTATHLDEILDKFIDRFLFDVQYAFEKVYIIPKGLTKGASVTRFLREFGEGRNSVSAGDSELDLSMLEITDRAIVPRDFNPRKPNFEYAPDIEFCKFALSLVAAIK